jgi:hypothetical protein
MIAKTKKGFYVYSAPTRNGRRIRLGGPFPTYTKAQQLNAGTKKGKQKKKRKR